LMTPLGILKPPLHVIHQGIELFVIVSASPR
jgi:hypothetical protein